MMHAMRCFGLLIDKIKDFFKKKPLKFVKFRDPLGNFEMFYPETWKFDQDVAVDDGKYAISFESGQNRFNIFVDFKLPESFSFTKYAKAELEGPSSGVISTIKKSKFRGLPAFKREYCYQDSGKEHLVKGIMFYTGKKVYSLTWFAVCDAPQDVFEHMIKSLIVRT